MSLELFQYIRQIIQENSIDVVLSLPCVGESKIVVVLNLCGTEDFAIF